jgi:hypothetical protein
MTSVRLVDGRVLHLPGAPSVTDSSSIIVPPADAELAALVPLIPADDLLLFTGRLVTGTRKRQRQARYAMVNAARLRLARLCIERTIAILDLMDGDTDIEDYTEHDEAEADAPGLIRGGGELIAAGTGR